MTRRASFAHSLRAGRRTSRPLERRLRAELHAARPPRAADVERRAWQIVRAAHAARPAAAPARRGPRLALAAGLAVLAAALALTPAGARVGDWIDDVVSPAPAPRDSLAPPAGGRLLVVGNGSAWRVAEDGARRRLGDFDDATWSPGGLFVAATHGRELVALEPGGGEQRWVRPAAAPVRSPRWSPDGFRVAYRSGSDLRVAIGNNEQDWLLARGVGPAPPAWKPLPEPQEQVLAFASGARVRIVEVDTRRLLGATPPGPPARQIWWAGRQLVVVSAEAVRIHSSTGRLLRTIDLPAGWAATGSALSPRGRRLALIMRGPDSRGRLLLVRLDREAEPRLLLDSGSALEGVAWSTDGSWLVVGRPEADQWLFVPPRDSAGLERVRGIRARFGGDGEAAGSQAGAFPIPAGWCYSEPIDRSASGQRPCLPGSGR